MVIDPLEICFVRLEGFDKSLARHVGLLDADIEYGALVGANAVDDVLQVGR